MLNEKQFITKLKELFESGLEKTNSDASSFRYLILFVRIVMSWEGILSDKMNVFVSDCCKLYTFTERSKLILSDSFCKYSYAY